MYGKLFKDPRASEVIKKYRYTYFYPTGHFDTTLTSVLWDQVFKTMVPIKLNKNNKCTYLISTPTGNLQYHSVCTRKL